MVVKAVMEEKLRYNKAAKIFGLSRYTVSKWVTTYKESGEKGIKTKKKGRPKGQTKLLP